ncbi:uncharacterized protein SPPG_07235 [Spizellomyces punctatus DAOM BR117]|uniref:Uncharacterized protein n=1 Tax=Spizellomyces punctatus (strain DAOM BR117) TaxID=645134 RepID=A0A0L0H8K5_SPIPD|nr:uncharacterized protein SPPG_07235 [Spizellomyces punctatus DAOM BR117]KNC97306.1 hypothetical protein SPPG_07235 [Spizellomyces punctatus DAOM BR117]|eukprot:XP_016605346.1 hypothetical protein SPPG_07235 [Spizellomyces punctatus DAOM BR117]
MSAEVRGAVKQLRTHQQGQLAKLQIKSEAEVELLENLNSYFRKRAEIESQYATALEKLSKHYITKKFKRTTVASGNPTPLSSAEDATAGALYASFSAVLTESEKQARKRGDISEKLVADIADNIRELNKERAAGAKRNLEFGTKYHQELWTAYDELDKARQAYDKTAKEAESARKKYDDISRKPGSGLNAIKNLVTGTDSEERVEKHRTKWKALSRKLNDSRNDYILALEGVNVIQAAYYKEELPNLMLNLDANFYTVYPSLLEKYAGLESDYTGALQTSVETVRTSLGNVDRNKELDNFLRDHNAIFQDPGPFHFEPGAGDDVEHLTVDDVTKVALGQRLGRLMNREEEINNHIALKERELGGVTQMADVYSQTPSFGNAATPLEQRQEIENGIRLLNAAKVKVAAQIRILKNMGVEAIIPVAPVTAAPTMSLASKANAVAIYDYDAKGEGETSLRNGDDLVIVVPESDGWVKVQNLISQGVGLVPANYIKNLEPVNGSGPAPSTLSPAGPKISDSPKSKQVKALYDFNATDEGELSFRAGDSIEVVDTSGDFSDEAWWEGRVARTGQIGQFPVVFTQGWQALAASAPSSITTSVASLARSVSTQQHRTSMLDTSSSRRSSTVMRPVSSVPKYPKVRAMYAYDSTCDGELTMAAGDIITVTNKNTGSDAWWEGEGPHGKGQFPVNYVELIDTASESSASLGAISKRSSLNPTPTPSYPQVKALYDYTASEPDEISFRAGDIIRVTQSADADWWQGELNGRSGAFPANYVQKI